MKYSLSLKAKKTFGELFKLYPQIIAGYVFGSRMKGTDIPSSDLDVGLICFTKERISPVELSFAIDERISQFETDVTVLDLHDDPLLLIQVINGDVFYEKTLDERVLLETRILHLYEDSQPLKRIKKYYLDKSFQEGIYANK